MPTLTLLVLALSVTSCTTSTPPAGTTIVITATSAEPRPALPESLRAGLTSLAKAAKKPGQAVVKVISSTAGPVAEHDIAPLRANGDVDHGSGADKKIDDKITGIEHLLAHTKAGGPGLDLLTLLDRAGQAQGTHIHVVSSGLSTADPMDWRAMGWVFDVDDFVDSLVQRGLLPDLSGREVTFYGLGVVAGSQLRLPPYARKLVEQLWLCVCARAGASQCTPGDASKAEPPAASLPVPIVPVADVKTEGGCPQWMSLSDETLHFAGGSADLPANADAVLRKITTEIRACTLTVDVAGHVADVGPGDDEDLSQRRAQAVADRLLLLDLPPAALGQVVGKGDREPVIANWTNGEFDEAKATQNRRVELSFSPSPR